MEPAILAVAARVPPWELSAETVNRAYGRPPARGARRFASWDEDPLTLAYAAADRALQSFDRSRLQTLFIASTSWPRHAAAQAERVAAALDLPEGVEVVSLGGAWRCGVSALRLAFESRRLPALVVAADRLTEPPGSDRETAVGDGAAAILVGEGPGLAQLSSWTSTADPVEWNSDDARFLAHQATRLASRVRREECGRAGVSAPGLRPARAAASALGLPASDAALERIGFCGAAHPLLALVELVESAGARAGPDPGSRSASSGEAAAGGRPRPGGGDRYLWVSCAEGLDAATVEITGPVPEATFAPAVERARPVTEYGRWLASRSFFENGAGRGVFSSPAIEQRDSEFLIRLHGARCASCRAIQTVPMPACGRCGSTAAPTRFPLSRTGTVFSFTHEYYVPTPAPPVTMAVVDLDGGGRIVVQVADAPPEAVALGTRIRLVLRRLHMGGGVPQYYWKAVME